MPKEAEPIIKAQRAEDFAITLGRIDERTIAMAKRLEDMESRFVTKDQFKPVLLIVYGMVGFILLAVLGAIVTLVVRSAPQDNAVHARP